MNTNSDTDMKSNDERQQFLDHVEQISRMVCKEFIPNFGETHYAQLKQAVNRIAGKPDKREYLDKGDINQSPSVPYNYNEKKRYDNIARSESYSYNQSTPTVTNVYIDNSVYVTNVTNINRNYHTQVNVGIGTDAIGTMMNGLSRLGGKIDRLFGL